MIPVILRNLTEVETTALQNKHDTRDKQTNTSEHNLNPRQIRSVYLITYSQADKNKFPSRNSFANAVVECATTGKIKLVNWVCSLEKHTTKGEHYHVAIK